MKIFLTLLISLFIGASIYAQENTANKKVTNAKSIDIRSNSRQQAIVKRDNFHQRRDIRSQQMKKMMKMSKNQRISGKRSLIKKNNKRANVKNKKQLQQKRLQQQKLKKLQRQQALKRKMKR